MKRIFSLLAALMCLSVSSVWAQDATTTTKKVQSIASDATPAASLTPGYYVIKVFTKKHDGYVFFNGNNVTNASSNVLRVKRSVSTDTISSNGSLAFVWYVTPSSDGKLISMQCAGNGGFFPYHEGHITSINKPKTLANATAYYYSQAYAKGVFLYQANYKNLYIHCNGNDNDEEYNIGYWTNAGDTNGQGSATLFNFYAVTLADGVKTPAVTDVANITYKRKIADTYENPVVESVKVAEVGSAATNPWTVYSDGVLEAQCSPSTIAADTKTVDVNFVKKTSSTIGLDTYHRLNIGRSTQLAVTKNGNISTKYCTKNFLANYLSSYWKFVQDGLQVKMVNCDGKYLKLTSVPTEYTEGKCKGAVQYVDNASDATNLYLCEKPSNSGYQGNGGFILKVGDPSNNVAIGDHDEKKLSAWKNSGAFADEGSCFVVADNADLLHISQILSARIYKDKNNQTEISNNILRVADTESLNLANSALAEVHENITPSELINAYNLAYKAKIDENAYYRIKNQGTSSNEATAKRYPSSEAIVTNTEGVLQAGATRTITRKTASDNMVAQLWQFKDAGDGNYFIQNANTGCRWAATEGNIDMPTMDNSGNAGHYSIDAIPVGGEAFSEGLISSVNDGKSKFFITLHLKGQHVINAYGGLNDFDILKEDNSQNAVPCNDPGNYWQIEKVTSIPVTITDAKYATVGYPFNVKVRNKDVRVYYAKEAANGVMKLTEATDQIIPANQGAILYYEGEGTTTANLDIVSETGAGFVDNILTASTAKRTGFTTKTTYGLSNKNGVVSFRLNTDTYVPANKSYLLATNYNSGSGSAQQLLFSFDNVVEGIDNAVVDGQNANKVYYDLQGRRVMYPAHGIFVTENGEKVFIK